MWCDSCFVSAHISCTTLSWLRCLFEKSSTMCVGVAFNLCILCRYGLCIP